MYFKNTVRDKNSSIPLTEIQGRSETASHFESTAPITHELQKGSPRLCTKVSYREMLR